MNKLNLVLLLIASISSAYAQSRPAVSTRPTLFNGTPGFKGGVGSTEARVGAQIGDELFDGTLFEGEGLTDVEAKMAVTWMREAEKACKVAKELTPNGSAGNLDARNAANEKLAKDNNGAFADYSIKARTQEGDLIISSKKGKADLNCNAFDNAEVQSQIAKIEAAFTGKKEVNEKVDELTKTCTILPLAANSYHDFLLQFGRFKPVIQKTTCDPTDDLGELPKALGCHIGSSVMHLNFWNKTSEDSCFNTKNGSCLSNAISAGLSRIFENAKGLSSFLFSIPLAAVNGAYNYQSALDFIQNEGFGAAAKVAAQQVAGMVPPLSYLSSYFFSDPALEAMVDKSSFGALSTMHTPATLIAAFNRSPEAGIMELGRFVYENIFAAMPPEMGCQVWEGTAHVSKCLVKAANWDCASIDQKVQMLCAIPMILGADIFVAPFLMGKFQGVQMMARKMGGAGAVFGKMMQGVMMPTLMISGITDKIYKKIPVFNYLYKKIDRIQDNITQRAVMGSTNAGTKGLGFFDRLFSTDSRAADTNSSIIRLIEANEFRNGGIPSQFIDRPLKLNDAQEKATRADFAKNATELLLREGKEKLTRIQAEVIAKEISRLDPRTMHDFANRFLFDIEGKWAFIDKVKAEYGNSDFRTVDMKTKIREMAKNLTIADMQNRGPDETLRELTPPELIARSREAKNNQPESADMELTRLTLDQLSISKPEREAMEKIGNSFHAEAVLRDVNGDTKKFLGEFAASWAPEASVKGDRFKHLIKRAQEQGISHSVLYKSPDGERTLALVVPKPDGGTERMKVEFKDNSLRVGRLEEAEFKGMRAEMVNRMRDSGEVTLFRNKKAQESAVKAEGLFKDLKKFMADNNYKAEDMLTMKGNNKVKEERTRIVEAQKEALREDGFVFQPDVKDPGVILLKDSPKAKDSALSYLINSSIDYELTEGPYKGRKIAGVMIDTTSSLLKTEGALGGIVERNGKVYLNLSPDALHTDSLKEPGEAMAWKDIEKKKEACSTGG